MVNKKIALIANGKSAIALKCGKIIDNFPVVGRINNYSTSRYKQYIGEKTDIWFNGANQHLKKRKILPKSIVVMIPAAILKRKGNAIHKRINNRLGVDTGAYTLVPLTDMLRFEELIGVKRPTTGTSSILWSLENFAEVYIHGFDFFTIYKSHYNDGRFRSWLLEKGIMQKAGKHNITGEKQYVEGLIKTGRIRLLTELL